MAEHRYKFFTDGEKRVIAVATFAKKPVRGVAVCNDKDTFDVEIGKKIAAARCNYKIARKRTQRAREKMNEAFLALCDAEANYDYYCKYFEDAFNAESEAFETMDATKEY